MRLWVAALVLVAGGTQVIVRTPPAPIINSLSVTSGPVGTTVVLTGVHFGTTQGSGTVVFASAVTATPTAWNDISITVTVPVGAITGAVVVVQNGVTSNPLTFTVQSGGTAQTCSGTTYYVRTDGSNGNTGTVNSPGGAWQTIGNGVSTATANDCVRVQAGTYVETASVTHSGTSGHPLTVVADGTVNTCGMSFSSQSYVRIVGLTFDPTINAGCGSPSSLVSFTGTNTGLEFWGITVQNQNGNGGMGSFSAGIRCNACIIVGGTFFNIGTGGSLGLSLYGNDDFVGYVQFDTMCYVALAPSGSRGRYVNNDFIRMCDFPVHADFFYPDPVGDTSGFSGVLSESTFGIGTSTNSQQKYAHQQNQSTVDWADNVYRLNVGYNLGSSIYSIYSSTNNVNNWRMHWYNNSWVLDERSVVTPGCGTGSAQNTGSNVTVYFTNEIAYECWGPSNTTNIDLWEPQGSTGTLTLFRAYNLGFSPNHAVTFGGSWTGQTGAQSNVDPKLVNVAGQDFTLQSTSGARGVGGPITTAVSCSGTTLNVQTNYGGSFIGDDSANLPQYGGKLAPGDTITVNAAQYTVSSVSGDALTLGSSITCASGDNVFFGNTSTIDMGAYPYKAGGYTLTGTKVLAGSTWTITPNDTSLVRMVGCFEGGIPYALVTASPYTCANPAGTFQARIYPRYASATHWVVP